jgi:hypothetical protein
MFASRSIKRNEWAFDRLGPFCANWNEINAIWRLLMKCEGFEFLVGLVEKFLTEKKIYDLSLAWECPELYNKFKIEIDKKWETQDADI